MRIQELSGQPIPADLADELKAVADDPDAGRAVGMEHAVADERAAARAGRTVPALLHLQPLEGDDRGAHRSGYGTGVAALMSVDLSTPEGAFGIASLVLLLALIAVRLSRRIGMPSLLLYLGIGLVLGHRRLRSGPDQRAAHRATGLRRAGLHPGRGRSDHPLGQRPPGAGPRHLAGHRRRWWCRSRWPGSAVHLLLGFDWRTSLLWGAVLSSTDAAAVFSVLRGVGVKPRLSAALELESGLNDAPVVIAVMLLAGTTEITWVDPLLVVYELIAGAIIGGAIGFARRLAAAPGGPAGGGAVPAGDHRADRRRLRGRRCSRTRPASWPSTWPPSSWATPGCRTGRPRCPSPRAWAGSRRSACSSCSGCTSTPRGCRRR